MKRGPAVWDDPNTLTGEARNDRLKADGVGSRVEEVGGDGDATGGVVKSR